MAYDTYGDPSDAGNFRPFDTPAPPPPQNTGTNTSSVGPVTGAYDTYGDPSGAGNFRPFDPPASSSNTNTNTSSVGPVTGAGYTPPATVTPPPPPVQPPVQPQPNQFADMQAQYNKQQEEYNKQNAALQKLIADNAEQQKRAQEQQNISLRDMANQFNVPIDFKDGQLTLNGQTVNTEQLGLKNVDGRFVGSPDQVASAFGLSPIRNSFEQSGADVGYADGLISVNGVNFDPNAEGLVNIGGRFYANPETINSIHQRAGGTEFNPQAQNTQQTQEAQQTPQQQTAEDAKVQQLDEDIKFLQDTQMKVFENPPKDHTDQILTIVNSLNAWKGVYTDQVGSLIQQTLASTFDYKPETDSMLQDAAKYANNQIMEQMNARGILSSSVTGEKFQQMYKELMPKYYNLAYQRYNDNLNNSFKKIEVLNKMNEQDYDKYYQFASASISQIEKIDTKAYNSFKDNLDFINKQLVSKEKGKSDTLSLQEKKIANAYDRLNELGYVDNKTSLILELPVGTPSGAAKAKAEQRLFDLQKEANSVIAENKKAALVRQQKLEDLQVTRNEKKADDDRKAKAGDVLASLSGMSGEAAMAEVRKNISILSDILGENFPEVVKNIQSRIDKDTSEAMADKRLGLSIASSERVANKANADENYKNVKDSVLADIASISKTADKYWVVKGSAERRAAFDFAMGQLRKADVSPDQINNIINATGLTEFK